MKHHKLKLLFVIVDLTGGTGTFTRNLGGGLKSLFPEEFETALLTLRAGTVRASDHALFDDVWELNTGVHEDWRRFFEAPLHLLKLRKAIGAIKPDVIFTIGTYSNVLASLVRGEAPVVLSEHMDMSLRVRAAPFGWIMRSFMRELYPRSLVVCAAPGITRDLEQSFGVKRTRVIPNGLDADRVRALAQEDPGPLPTTLPYLVAVGRLTAQKDYPTLIRAFAQARARGLRMDLVAIGDGEDRAALEQLARSLRVEAAVHFVGQRSNPYPLMKRAQFLVLSSLWEGFAYVPVEAMALGVPCVATNSSGPAAILEDGKYGLLAPPADPAALATAMLRMAEPAEREHFVAQSRVRSEQLSIEHMARAYRDMFAAEARNGFDT